MRRFRRVSFFRAHAAISVPALPWGAALVAPALPATACSPHASAAVPHVCETQRSPAPARRRAPSRIERGRRAVKCLATSSTVMGLRIGCSCGKRQVQRGSGARMLCVQGEQVSSRFITRIVSGAGMLGEPAAPEQPWSNAPGVTSLATCGKPHAPPAWREKRKPDHR